MRNKQTVKSTNQFREYKHKDKIQGTLRLEHNKNTYIFMLRVNMFHLKAFVRVLR